MVQLSEEFQNNIYQLTENVRYLLFQMVHFHSDLNHHLKLTALEMQLKNIFVENLETIIADTSILNDILIQLQSDGPDNLKEFVEGYKNARLD